MSKCAVIVSGGMLEDQLVIQTIEKENDPWIIGVDKGVECLYRNHILPSYIVGDSFRRDRKLL